MDRETLLRFRVFLENASWGNFEEYLKTRLDRSHSVLEVCPLENVEHHRGEIKILRELLSLKSAARRAYLEGKDD